MQCQKCCSDNTQRLEVAFEAGSQNITAKSYTADAGSFSGALGIGGAITKTSGTSQSVLAQKIAPPAKKRLKWSVVTVIVGLLCVIYGSWGVVIFGLLLLAVSGYFEYTAYKFNTQQWPSLYQYWCESWVCHKCGHIYHQA